MKTFLLLASIGLFTGIINGLLGMGGGSLLVPLLVFVVGIKQHIAHGTSLAVILPTAFISSIIYWFNGNLDLNLALKVALSSMVGGYIGAKLMNKIPGPSLRKIFGLFIIIAGFRMVI